MLRALRHNYPRSRLLDTRARRYRHFQLLSQLASAQFKNKDQSTALGLLWSFLHPLLLLSLLYVFFNARLGQGVEHYAIYLLIGLVQYTHFSNSTVAGMRALASMRQIAKETIFPKILLVASSVISTSVELFISMAICCLLAALSGVSLQWPVLALPLVCILQIAFVFWISVLLACVFTYVHDIAHLYTVFLRVLFFTTPIFYAPEFLGDGLARYIVRLNPLAQLIDFTRSLLLEGNVLPIGLVLLHLAANLILIALSVKLFSRCEPSLAERL